MYKSKYGYEPGKFKNTDQLGEYILNLENGKLLSKLFIDSVINNGVEQSKPELNSVKSLC